MREFAYERAADADAAVALAARPGAAYLGGGTNLVDLMKLGVATPSVLVDVSRLPLTEVARTAGGLMIGAAVRNSDLAAHPDVRRDFPVLSRALLAGASGQLRNAATVGGNLLQRTRCLYFQDVTKPCNKRSPGSGCPAREGIHRNLAILGASEHCVATHPSDMAVALAALDAVVHVHGQDPIPVTSLHRLPGDDPSRDTVLPDGALITGVEVPSFAGRSTYRKVRDRASYAFAVVSVAAGLVVSDGIVRDARIALGGVAHKPWRAHAAESLLRGAPATEDSFRRAASAELAAATPLRDNGFKIPLAVDVITSTLLEVAA